ncbi:MAG: metallophosphoesterase, partial [candidate division WOR-3 bacterium]|nr:metallophosphoesterase [candidate division WOR-3 bacterium]
MKLPFTIAHISDLHLGGSYFVPEWGNRLVDLLNRLKPDLIVITGDLTTEGHIHEYDQVVRYLKRFHSKNRIIVPGNHDARNEGYVIFEVIFGTRYPFYKKSNIAIFGVDSS